MTWALEFDARALKSLRKLDKQAQQDILRYCRERIAGDADPRRLGKPLSGSKAGLWRYRVHDYRIVCSIEEEKLIVLVLHVGHRKNVYQ